MKIRLKKNIKDKKTGDEVESLSVVYVRSEPVKKIEYVIGEDGEKYLPDSFEVVNDRE